MRALAAAVLLLICGCAGLPPREPTSLRHGMLVVRAVVRGAILPFTSDVADSAGVEQLGPDGNPIPGVVASAGVSGDGYAYFLDLPTGRYALTSISFRARGARYVVEIPPALGRKWAVDLRPGSAAFLGEYVLYGRFPEFDVAVERALPVLGHWLTPWMRRPVMPRDADARGFELGPKSEAAAMRGARKVLAATQWRRLAEARLRELSAPEPPKMKGTITKTEIPLHPESFLSWRDTLDWGAPKRSGNGLIWSDPKGSARVVVFFTTATAKGFSGYDAAVQEMRTNAASVSVEGSGDLYEVPVYSRTGMGSRVTSYHYPQETLLGSQAEVVVTETVLVPESFGMYTARLRVSKEEFDKVLPAFREFLLQLVLGPPRKTQSQSEDESEMLP